MTGTLKRMILLAIPATLSSFAGQAAPPPVPSGDAAYEAIPATAAVDLGAIEPRDRISIRVLGEPDISSDQYLVDDDGKLQMPLIGDIEAGGRTPAQLRDEIAKQLSTLYIRNAQVVVGIAERHKGTFTVEGEVREAGRFEATPEMTLLGAVAMARSPNNVANLSNVIILRTVKGQRMAARFDLHDVRSGRAPDPQIIAGDTVVVGYSVARGAWREFLQATPLFNIFYLVK